MSARTQQIKSYNAGYDYVRAAAALTVFLIHGITVIFKDNITRHYDLYILESLSALAVEFFFALSGLLLGQVLFHQFTGLKPRENIKIFIIRRLMRTLPVYYMGLALYFLIFTLLDKPYPEEWPLYFIFLQSLFYFNSGFFTVSWSLCVEELFYITLPVLIIIFAKFKFPARQSFIMAGILICAFCFLLRQIFLPSSTAWMFDIHTGVFFRLDAIAAGVVMILISPKISRRQFILSLLIISSITLTWMIYGYVLDGANAMHRLFLQASFTVLPWACAIAVYYISKEMHWLKRPLVTFLADISYALYVFHMPLLSFLFMAGLPENALITFMIYMPLALGIAYMSFRYVETPIFMRRPAYKTGDLPAEFRAD